MTTAQLQYFTTVAQLGNLSKAAKLLHLSQSSLSKNIARLEAELETQLFDRGGKKMTLNAAGSCFLDFSARTLGELEKTREALKILSTGHESRIRVGAAGAGAALMGCVAEFCRKHPETEFDINCGVESEEYVDINDMDVLIYPDEPKYERFSGYRLCRERCYLAVSDRHELAENVSVAPKQLGGLSFVFLRDKANAHAEFTLRLCMALNIRAGAEYFVDSRELHRQMVASGIAAGFVPEGEAQQYRSDPGIRLLPIHDERFSRELMICFKREKHLSELAKSFKDFAIEYFKLEGRPENE